MTTHGADGVNLYNGNQRYHYDSSPLQPISTIGAGDNFNAGVIYGLLKYNIGKKDLATLSEEMWGRIVHCGIDLASEVCQSYDNYISKEFASNYRQQS